MANKLYTKDEMNFEGISMQEGKSSSTLKLLAFMIVTAVILGLLIFTAGSFLAGENDENDDVPQITILPTSSRADPTEEPIPTKSEATTPSVTPKVTAEKTPSPTRAANKSSLTVEILNGSGVKGAAGKMSTALTNAGYNVSRTGNADAFDYTGVSVNIKKSKSILLDQLKKDLSAADYIVTESTSVLSEASTADAVIILGVEE